MRIFSHSIIGVLLLGGATSQAQQLSRFEAHPKERQHFVERMKEQADKNRKEVDAWAKSSGQAIRFERNGKLYQISSIRNGQPEYLVTHNIDAGISSAANLVWPNPYNLNGAGVTVGVWDASKARITHQEFGGRVSALASQTEPLHSHASHVVGTVAASGVDMNAKGMAPAVSVISYDWNSDISEMGGKAASAQGQSSKIYLSNHSYGWAVGWDDDENLGNQIKFGQYNTNAQKIDEVVANSLYYLPFVSAGNDRDEDANHNNDGYETIADYSVAKNVMVVGAVKDAESAGTRSLAGATLAYFSSGGPCDDGRVKPDVVADGWGLKSCVETSDSAYDVKYGTSMSSPSACGSAALLVDHYDNLFPGGAMRASTLKGLIIHTADDLGNPGPDYSYGWGLMNTLTAADLLKDYAGGATIKLTEATVTTNHPSNTYQFLWNGADPIRVTLCWTDPADSASSADDDREPDLVNDLDLRITGPGATHYPYKLSYASPTANATASGKNDIDNVEQVYIAAPTAGEYTITVDFDGGLNLGRDQWYSLFVTGDSGDSDSDGIPDSWEVLYFGGVTNAVATSDLDGDGSDNYSEYVAGTLPNNASSVFEVTSFSASPDGGSPFILNWSTVPGRVYSVDYTYNLQYIDFASFIDAINLPYTQNSYTDMVERAGSAHFYRVGVQLDQ